MTKPRRLILGGIGLLLIYTGLCWPAHSQPTPANNPQAMVYVTEHGKVFHSAKSCSYLKKSTEIYMTQRGEAESHGLKPCHLCYGRVAAQKTWKKQEVTR